MVETARPLRVFCVYAAEDLAHFESLGRHLLPLMRTGAIDVRGSGEGPPGEMPEQFLVDEIGLADVIVLLLSADFLAWEASELAIQHALHRRGQGLAEVVVVVARACVWEWTALAELDALPDGGKPITSWTDSDEAWVNVVRGIRRVILARHAGQEPPGPSMAPEARPLRGPRRTETSAGQEPPGPSMAPQPSTEEGTHWPAATGGPGPGKKRRPPGQRGRKAPAKPIPIHEIFRTTGQPDINFVEPEQLADIRNRLAMMGQGLVVQGPSGVGKTTAVKKALAELSTSCTLLSSKKPADVEKLREILATSLAGGGHLVIDDFHRLAADLQHAVADLIKILADEDRRDAKVTVIGINPVGLSLVRDFPDLANRFAVISMGKQPPEKIDELIRKGAQAANIRFDRHAELVREAAGSFYTAQLLCLEAALKEGVTETAKQLRTISVGPGGYVMDRVQQGLAFKYHVPLMTFATCDERPPPRGACLALLWLLSQAEDISVSLETARFRYPQLAAAFDWLMSSHLSRHFEAYPRLQDLFHYNRDGAVLSAEDPQLEFYLRNLRWEAFARDTGHEGLRWDIEKGPLFGAPGGITMAPAAPKGLKGMLSPFPLPASVVLHLSDLHFGSKADAALWADQLLSDLRHELGCKHVDVLILSGDIANYAVAEEYQAAYQFLLTVKQELRLSPQQIILVPGNHDASWGISRAAYSVTRRSDHKGRLEEGQFIDGGDYVEVKDDGKYRQRFAAFADFYHSVRLESYPLDDEQQATLHYFPAQRLLILGLNSAWALDHHFRTRAGIHHVALGQALRLVRTTAAYAECLKLAVWHHPLHGEGEDRIKDTGFMERLAQEGFRLGLHGHIHKADTGLFLHDVRSGDRRVDLVGAGTFGAPVRELVPGYPLQYQLLRFHGDKVTVETRRREERNGAWKPDARWLQGPGKDPLPRYEIQLG